jgi:hypothetical protein
MVAYHSILLDLTYILHLDILARDLLLFVLLGLLLYGQTFTHFHFLRSYDRWQFMIEMLRIWLAPQFLRRIVDAVLTQPLENVTGLLGNRILPQMLAFLKT